MHITSKTCPCCRQTKALSDFYRNTQHVHGVARTCKSCDNENRQARRDAKLLEGNTASTEQLLDLIRHAGNRTAALRFAKILALKQKQTTAHVA